MKLPAIIHPSLFLFLSLCLHSLSFPPPFFHIARIFERACKSTLGLVSFSLAEFLPSYTNVLVYGFFSFLYILRIYPSWTSACLFHYVNSSRLFYYVVFWSSLLDFSWLLLLSPENIGRGRNGFCITWIWQRAYPFIAWKRWFEEANRELYWVCW